MAGAWGTNQDPRLIAAQQKLGMTTQTQPANVGTATQNPGNVDMYGNPVGYDVDMYGNPVGYDASTQVGSDYQAIGDPQGDVWGTDQDPRLLAAQERLNALQPSSGPTGNTSTWTESDWARYNQSQQPASEEPFQARNPITGQPVNIGSYQPRRASTPRPRTPQPMPQTPQPMPQTPVTGQPAPNISYIPEDNMAQRESYALQSIGIDDNGGGYPQPDNTANPAYTSWQQAPFQQQIASFIGGGAPEQAYGAAQQAYGGKGGGQGQQQPNNNMGMPTSAGAGGKGGSAGYGNPAEKQAAANARYNNTGGSGKGG